MYSTREVAEAWSVNPETIRRLAVRGLLRSVRVGSERRYPESALREGDWGQIFMFHPLAPTAPRAAGARSISELKAGIAAGRR